MNRAENLRLLKSFTSWDLIVIGGGAIGISCLLEGARRGYKVLLLEANDFASGTSSRSSKMIHGGLRYLRQLDVHMVRESLTERGYLLQHASSWVKEQRIIIPAYDYQELMFYRTGLLFYDMLAKGYKCTLSKLLSARETAAALPGLKTSGLKGGIAYSDGLFDDARLAIGMVQAAAKLDGKAINHIKVVALLKNPSGEITGVKAWDRIAEKYYDLEAGRVINAAGTFADNIIDLDELRSQKTQIISQGSHLVLPRAVNPSDLGIMIPKTADGRVMFCLPWQGRTLLGTTDVEQPEATEEPKPAQDEIEFILTTCNPYLKEQISRADILSCFAGQRALVSGNNSTKNLSRSAKLITSESGLISILGGKWTTCCAIAKNAVDLALGPQVEGGRVILDNYYSARAAKSDDKKLHPNLPYTEAQVLSAVREEMAMTLEDVLARRTRALFLDSQAALDCATKVAELMAQASNHEQHWIDEALVEFSKSAKQYLLQ